MAPVTGCRQGCVVVVNVAARTRRRYMRAGQRKCGVVVIESCRNPRRCVVAYLTRLRKSCRSMIRVIRAVVVLHVAGRAGSAGQVVIPVYVTLRALHIGMRAS